jgi:hypothetical protein
VVDEYGRPLGKDDDNSTKNLSLEPKNLDEAMFKMGDSSSSASSISASAKKKYTPINSYKPQGNLVYGEDLLNSLEDVFDNV